MEESRKPDVEAGLPMTSSPSSTSDETAVSSELCEAPVLTDGLMTAFGDLAIGGGAWAVELTSVTTRPNGELQQIRLQPKRHGYQSLIAGAVNRVDQVAELRDYDYLSVFHEVRFHRPLRIEPGEWNEFLRRAEAVLNGAGIQSLRTPPPRELLEQRRSMRRVSRGAIVLLIIVILLAVIVVWRVIVTLSASGA